MDTLKFPLTFKNGDAKVLTYATRPYYTQLLSLGIQTAIGDLPITTGYGVIDPSFDVGAKEQLLTISNLYIPEINLTKISETVTTEGVIDLKVTFDINS